MERCEYGNRQSTIDDQTIVNRQSYDANSYC
jgi:hypothetical protein